MLFGLKDFVESGIGPVSILHYKAYLRVNLCLNCRFKSETGAGEGYGKCAAFTRFAENGDISAMGPGNGAGKAQAQTDAGL
jgi:hypothetical protein